MTIPTHDHSIPPYVHNLVVEAGRDNVFWASARDPGERPDTGASMSEWRNRVVGSSQEATQSTASAQPIWRGTEVEFGGDDFLESTFDASAADAFTIIGVWSRDSGSAVREFVSGGDKSDFQPFFDILSPDDADLRTRVNDGNGNGPNVSTVVGLDLASTFASAHQVRWDESRTKHWVLDNGGGGISKEEATSSMTRPSTWPRHTIGARLDENFHLVGPIKELIMVAGDVSDPEVVGILKTLQARWRI